MGALAARTTDVMSLADPAHPIIMGIARLVPSSHWSYARMDASGRLTTLLADGDGAGGLEDLEREYRRQRATSRGGPRIAATLAPGDDVASGITMLFSDAKTDFGILVLARDAELGLFTSIEVGMLCFALDSVSDRLATLRLNLEPRAHVPELVPRSYDHVRVDSTNSAMYVLDADLAILLRWSSDDGVRGAVAGLATRDGERLPDLLEGAVRRLTAPWANGGARQAGLAYPVPFLALRTTPMSGRGGVFIGVRIDRSPTSSSLSEAAGRYNISSRELQVLALLLDGRHLAEVATLLSITSSTVQDHIKSMIGKTGSRNRSELIAHVLGWEAAPAAY